MAQNWKEYLLSSPKPKYTEDQINSSLRQQAYQQQAINEARARSAETGAPAPTAIRVPSQQTFSDYYTPPVTARQTTPTTQRQPLQTNKGEDVIDRQLRSAAMARAAAVRNGDNDVIGRQMRTAADPNTSGLLSGVNFMAPGQKAPQYKADGTIDWSATSSNPMRSVLKDAQIKNNEEYLDYAKWKDAPYQPADLDEQYADVLRDRQLLQSQRDLNQANNEHAITSAIENIKSMQDYAEKSKYKSTANNRPAKFAATENGVEYTETGYDDDIYEYVNGNKDAIKYVEANNTTNGNNALGHSITYLTRMTADEVGAYNYIYANDGKDAANEYLSAIERRLTAREAKAIEDAVRAEAGDGVANGIGWTLAQAVVNLDKPITYLNQAASLAFTGEIDENAAYNYPSLIQTAAVDEISNNIAEKWGPVGSFAYQTGVSMLNFLTTTAATGGFVTGGTALAGLSEAVALGIMSTGAAADATLEAKKKGIDDDEAFFIGSIAGAAEFITEKVSLDALFDAKAISKSRLVYVLQNAFTEGSEEVGSDIINAVADIFAAGTEGEFEQKLIQLIEQGYSYKDAMSKVLADKAGETALSFAGGALSGGIMAGVGAANYTRTASNGGKAMQTELNGYGETTQDMIDFALSSDDADLHDVALKYQSKLDSGKQLSNYEIGNLQNAIEMYASEYAENNGISADDAYGILRDSVSEGIRESNAQQQAQSNTPFAVQAATSITPQSATRATAIEQQLMAAQQTEQTAQTAPVQTAMPADSGARIAAQEIYNPENLTPVAETLDDGGKDAMIKAYDGNLPTDVYAGDFLRVYNAAKNGEATPTDVRLNAEQMAWAQTAGEIDGGNAVQNMQEVNNNGRENAVSEGGQRYVGESAGVEGGRMAESTERNQERQTESGRGQGSRTDGLVAQNNGRKVSGASLVDGGSETASLTMYDVGTNEDANAAQKVAADRGYKLRIFGGGNIETTVQDANGNAVKVSARGMINESTKEIFARADDADFTIEQIARHEAGHAMLDAGEVDLAAFSEKVAELGVPIGSIAQMYSQLYPDLTAQEIYDEIICDSLADMNIFGAQGAAADEALAKVRGAIRDSVESSTVASRAPPSEEKSQQKFSRAATNVDSEGNSLSPQQQEYFADSKVRDADGNLKVMYRGGNEEFTIFDRKKSKASNLYGRGFYFTDSESHAKQYGNAKPFYLNVTNPISPGQSNITKSQMRAFIEAIAENEDYGIENYGYGATVSSVLDSVWGKGDFEMLQDVNASAVGDLVAAVELFNEVNGTNYDGIVLPTETVTFASEQAKNIDNKTPTNNPDIRYSRAATETELAAENRELQAQVNELQKKLRSSEKWRSYWQAQTKTTKGVQLRDGDIAANVTEPMLKAFSSKADAAEVTAGIKDIAVTMLEGAATKRGINWSAVQEKAANVASDIVRNAKELQNEDAVRDYAKIREYFKTTKIQAPAALFKGIPDFTEFKSSLRGKMQLRNAEGIPVDVAYAELSDQYPWAFPADIINPEDQLLQIADTLRNFEEIYYNPYDVDMAGAIQYCANGIIDRVSSGLFNAENGGDKDGSIRLTPKTFADEQSEKLEQTRSAADAERKAAVDEATLAAQMSEGRRVASAARTEIRHLEERLTKANELVKEVRRRRDRAYHDRVQHNAEVRKARMAAKADSDARSKLLAVSKRLAKMKLTDDNRAVLNQLVQSIIPTANDLFDLDLKSKGMKDATASKLTELRDRIEEAELNNPDYIIPQHIKDAAARLSKLHINDDLTLEQVNDLVDVLRNFENQQRTANKLIDSEVRRDIQEAGQQTIRDIENSNGKGKNTKAAKFEMSLYSPERAVHRMVGYNDSSPLYIATKELSSGQRAMMDYSRRANQMFSKWLDDKSYTNYLTGKKANLMHFAFHDAQGRPFNIVITPAMAISLVLSSRNDQNMRHITDGGIRIPNMKEYMDGNMDSAYSNGKDVRLTKSQIAEIQSKLYAKDNAYAKRNAEFLAAVSKYFNEMSKTEINDVSEKLNGYSLARVENYFPIDTNRRFLSADFETIKQDGSIEGMGFTHERIDSSKPVMLYDANMVLNKSISQHSKYVGLAIPVRNFNKLWNVTTGDFSTNEAFDVTKFHAENSVSNAIDKMWGKVGVDYIQDLMTDLSNVRRQTDGETLSKLRSNFAAATLTLNLGVAMKQAASYPTAAAVIGWTPLVKAMGNLGKVNLDLIAKYTPLQYYRSLGYSSQELGDLAKQGKQLPKALNWIQAIDLATTRKLWKAAEYYIRDTNKQLKVGTDEYYKAVANVYNQIIEETQPDYTVMQRPGLLRTNNELKKTLVMFKTQPLQNLNILMDAVGDYNAKHKAYLNTKSDTAKAALAASKKKLGKALGSQIVSALVFSLMQFAWDAMRRKTKKYEDDEGNVTFGNAAKGVGLNAASSVLGMVPFMSEAFTFASSLVDAVSKTVGGDAIIGETFYGITDNVVESVSNFASAVTKVVTAAVKPIADSNDPEKTVDWEKSIRDIFDGLTDGAEVFGAPSGNVKNMISAASQWIAKAVGGGAYGDYMALRLQYNPNSSGDKKQFNELLWKLYKTDDMEGYNKVAQSLKDDAGWTDKQLKSNLQTHMGKDIDYDAMYKALEEGNTKEYERLRKDAINVDSSVFKKMQAAKAKGDEAQYAKLLEKSRNNANVDGSDIDSKMRSMMDKRIEVDETYKLPAASQSAIGVSYENKTEKQSVNFKPYDLPANEYGKYAKEKSTTISDVEKLAKQHNMFPSGNKADDAFEDKFNGKLESLAQDMALERASGGLYTRPDSTTAWQDYATNGGSYGVDAAEMLLFMTAYDMAAEMVPDDQKDGSWRKDYTMQWAAANMPWLTPQELAYMKHWKWKT